MKLAARQVRPEFVTNAAGVAVLFRGGRHRVEAFSPRAGAIAPQLEHGATVRSVFPAKEAKLPIMAMEAACDTKRPIVLREPMWDSIEWQGPGRPDTVRFVIRPVVEDEDSEKVLGTYVEAARVAAIPAYLEVDPVIETVAGTMLGDDVKQIIANDPVTDALPALYEQGAVAFALAKSHGLTPGDAVSLLAIRHSAKEAFVAGCKPLVEELRRRGAKVGADLRDGSSLVGGLIALLLVG